RPRVTLFAARIPSKKHRDLQDMTSGSLFRMGFCPRSGWVSFRPLLGKAHMDDSHTNPPPPAPAAPTSSSSAENSGKPPENIPPPKEATTSTPGAQAQLPPQPSKAAKVSGWIKATIMAQTCLPEDDCALLTYWVMSTWFQDALAVLPCLVITGPAYDAKIVLHALRDFCRRPA